MSDDAFTTACGERTEVGEEVTRAGPGSERPLRCVARLGFAERSVFCSTERKVPRVRSVREEGRNVSGQYGRRDETCPVSTD
jgi:hypothetical protein